MFYIPNPILAAAAIAVLAPFSVSAATFGPTDVTNGSFHSLAQVLNVGDNLQFDFEVSQNTFIPTFALSATGNNGGADVGAITFGFMNPTLDVFETIVDFGGSAAGLDSLPGGIFSVGDVFSIIFNGSTINDVAVTVSFEALDVSVSPVPLPASGLLLALSIFGTSVAARRRGGKS